MAQKHPLKNDNFIAKIVADPKQVPDALLLQGFLGASSEDKHTRLYFNPQLNAYVEIPDDAILYTQDISQEASPLGGSYVWIKKDAELIHGKAGSDRTKAKFLEGPIVNNYMKAAWPEEGGIDNTVAFCPITFADLPCGFTSLPIACTIVQVPTQQANCPSVNCPPTFSCPPTVWHCPVPTRGNHACPSVIALCHTQVCQVFEPGVAQQPLQAQPMALTIANCISQPWNCRPTVNMPWCPSPFTKNAPLCPISVNSPLCQYTANSPLCPTRDNSPLCNLPSVNQPCITRDNSPICNLPSVNAPCITRDLACVTTQSPLCNQPVTRTTGCDMPTAGNCPSLAGCPTQVCGFGGNFGY